MYKIIFFLWRRSDFTHQEFMDYNETKHAPLAISINPPMGDYRRNYPMWDQSAKSALGGFDVMTEIWHKDRSSFKTLIVAATTLPNSKILSDDEERFMNRATSIFLTVEERGMRPDDAVEERRRRNTAGGQLQKTIRFVRASTASNLEAFRASYEREVVPVIEAAVPRLVGYRRNYPLFDDEYSFMVGQSNHSKADPATQAFHLVEEFWTTGELELPPGEVTTFSSIYDHSGTHQLKFKECCFAGGYAFAPIAMEPRSVGSSDRT